MTQSALAEDFDCILFDLDGVLYRGPHAIEGVADSVNYLTHAGISRAFVTNNAGRTPQVVADHLTTLGMPASPDEVVTSAQAGAAILANMIAPKSRVYVVGGEGVFVALSQAGLEPSREIDGCVAVLQGFGPDVSWRELASASYLIQGGAVWVATNLDLTFPSDKGIAPGNGSLVQAVANSVGHGPHGVGGKPALALIDLVIKRTGAHRPLMVGDRYDTDIEAGIGAGMKTLLVLSGVCDIDGVWRSALRADYLAETAAALSQPYPQIQVSVGVAVCNSAKATWEDHAVSVSGGSAIDQLRAADALKWEMVSHTGLEPFISGEIALKLGA